MLDKQITIKQLLLALLTCACIFVAGFAGGCADASQSSFNGQQAAIAKWGDPGKGITNYYEYEQMQEIYRLRDNPNLILNAYLFSDMTGTLTCLGRVKGFGVPYGTQQSPPSSGTQPVPEPNGLYPSQDTNADWIQLIGPNGKTSITFVEPNMLITEISLPCKPLSS